jgi:hypothetical protein
MKNQVSWKSPTLNKGQFMFKEVDGYVLQVEHVDRTIAPYLAMAISPGSVIIYSGLHPTLASARERCEQAAKDPNP